MRLTVLGSPQCRKLQSQISRYVHVNLHGQIEVEDDGCREPKNGRQIGGNIRLERDQPAEADWQYICAGSLPFSTCALAMTCPGPVGRLFVWNDPHPSELSIRSPPKASSPKALPSPTAGLFSRTPEERPARNSRATPALWCDLLLFSASQYRPG